MKKTITLMLLLAMAGSANADLVLKSERNIRFCPGVFTKSGESITYLYSDLKDKNDVTIYSPDFLVDKTFSPVLPEFQEGSFTEEATVILTGMNVVPEDQYGNKNYSMSAQWEASSQEEMLNKLGSLYTAFTDPMGNPACYPGYTSFKYSNIFGRQYPTSWYALIDGMVYNIYTYDAFYTLAYDEESAVWTRTSEDIRILE